MAFSVITRRAIVVASAFWLCASFACAQQSSASAADTASARELFREAARLAQDGQWQEALQRYERSMALRPSSLTRYSLALAQKETGHLVDAMENLRAFLRVTDDPSIEPYRSAASDLLASIEPRIAYVRITVKGPIPKGLELLVDSQPVAHAAFNIERPIDPGSRKFQVKAPGYKTRNETLNFAEAEHKGMDITLEAEAVSIVSPVSVKPNSPEAPPVNSEPSPSLLGPGLLIGGGVAILSGLGLGAWGYSKAQSATTRDGSDADSARSLALAGDITMGVGLAASAAGLWLVLSPPSATTTTATIVSPWMSASSVGFSGQGHF